MGEVGVRRPLGPMSGSPNTDELLTKGWNPEAMESLRSGYRDMFSSDRSSIPAGKEGKEYGSGIFTSDVKRTTRERLEAIEEFIELMQAHARQERAVAQKFVADLQHNLLTLREENILLEKQAIQLRGALDRSEQRISLLEESNIALGERVSQMAEDHRERHSDLHRELHEVKDGIGFVSQHDLPVSPNSTRNSPLLTSSLMNGSNRSEISNGSGGGNLHSPPATQPRTASGKRTPSNQNLSSRLLSRGSGGSPLPEPDVSSIAAIHESSRTGISEKSILRGGSSPHTRASPPFPRPGGSPTSVRTEMLLARYGSSMVKE